MNWTTIEARLPRALWVSAWRYRLISFWSRAGIAWRYLTRRMTQDDARELYLPVTEAAGWRPLVTIDNDSVLDLLLSVYRDDPRLADLADDACARVAHKWPGMDEAAGSAQDWALELVEEYAIRDGIDLIKIEAKSEDEPAEEEA